MKKSSTILQIFCTFITIQTNAWELPNIGEMAHSLYQSTFHIESRIKQKIQSPSQMRNLCESYAGRYELKKLEGNEKKDVYIGNCICRLNSRPIFDSPELSIV